MTIKSENVIVNKSCSFAIEIIKLSRKIKNNYKELVLSQQILKSGTSIGANVKEAEHAQSRADFIHKMSIALKEANETEYWLFLLFKGNFIDESEFKKLSNQITEILKILIKIVKSSKEISKR